VGIGFRIRSCAGKKDAVDDNAAAPRGAAAIATQEIVSPE
jgi:hypothetical protein